MEKVFIAIGAIALLVVLIVGIGALVAFPVMWLVNGLFTSTVILTVFGVTKVGFLQAWGVLILSGLLFKSTNTSSK